MAKIGELVAELKIDDSSFKSGLNKAESSLTSFGSNIAKGAKQLTNFAFVLGGAGVAATTFGLKTAADFETARQGMVTLLGSAEAADETMQRLKKEAARTPFELPGLTNATQLLASVTKDGNKSIDILLDVGESLAAMGKGQAELDRIVVNLQQIGAVGKASIIDIKQFAFAGIPIFEMLQQETGLAGDALSDFISEGGVTFDLLTAMFDKSTAEGGRFFGAFANQAGTLSQLVSNLKDNFTVLGAEIVTESGIFDIAKTAISKLNDFFTANKEKIIDLIKNGLQKLRSIFEKIISIVTLVVAKAKELAEAIGLNKEDMNEFIKIAGILTLAVIGIAAAFILLTSPLLAIIAVIAGVAAIIVLLKKAWEENFLGIRETVTELWEKYLQPFAAFMESVFKVVLPIAIEILRATIEKLKEGFTILWSIVGPVLELLIATFKLVGKVLVAVWNELIKPVLEKLAKFFMSEIVPAIQSIYNPIKKVFDDISNKVLQPIKNSFNEMIEQIKKFTDMLNSISLDQITGVFDSLGGKLGLASGGPAHAGKPYTIGERGKEVFVPKQDGKVVPNSQLGDTDNRTISINNYFTDNQDSSSVVSRLGFQLKYI